MERKKPQAEENQARRTKAARLLFFVLSAVCLGCVLYPAAGLFRAPAPALRVHAQQTRFIPSLANEEDGKLNINQATAEELQETPGIGPAIAERIIAARDTFGGFFFLEELKDVPGVGEARFAALAERFFCPLPEGDGTE